MRGSGGPGFEDSVQEVTVLDQVEGVQHTGLARCERNEPAPSSGHFPPEVASQAWPVARGRGGRLVVSQQSSTIRVGILSQPRQAEAGANRGDTDEKKETCDGETEETADGKGGRRRRGVDSRN